MSFFLQPRRSFPEQGLAVCINNTIFDHTPLHEGSSFTVCSSSVLVMKCKMRHNLTQEALADLLQLLNLHCPSPNQCPSSVYLFNKQYCGSDLSVPDSASSFIEVPLDSQLRVLLERKSRVFR